MAVRIHLAPSLAIPAISLSISSVGPVNSTTPVEMPT